MTPPTPARVNVLGVGISAIDMGSTVALVRHWIDNHESRYVCVRDVHGVVACQRDDELRTIHNRADLVTPDGMPLVWLARREYPHVERVYGPDLMLELCRESIRPGWRHFFYGGAEGVPERLAEGLGRRFPGLQVADTLSPPFRPLTTAEDEEITKRIRESQAQIVWVGLSTPKQEYWMASHVNRLGPSILIGVGAAFDFHSGRKRQAPRWIQRSGFEWLFRLASEPRRLGARYLLNNPSFLALLLLKRLGLKRYSLD